MQQELTINLKGKMKVVADIRGFTVSTDQRKDDDGDNTAPTPLELFFASVGTCAGVNVAFFCIEREIPYKDIDIRMVIDRDDKTHAVKKINMNIRVPPDFPEKYKPALLKAVDACAVKKTIMAQPEIVANIINGNKV
jgi:putative redox protein